MNIKDLYLQSYIEGGTGLAKKEALQIPKAFNADRRKRLRHLLFGKKDPYFSELVELTKKGIPEDALPFFKTQDWVVGYSNLDPKQKWLTLNEQMRQLHNIDFITISALKKSPKLVKSSIDFIKKELKEIEHQRARFRGWEPTRTKEDVFPSFSLHTLFREYAKKRAMRLTGRKVTDINDIPDIENFDMLYKGFDGTPFRRLRPAHSAPTTGGYADNKALWFAPRRDTALGYGDELATFETTPEIKAFAERTSTPHLGSSVSWEDRISGKARRDAQTIYKGRGGKHYQEDPNDINFETVLPEQYWKYYLQHPELVTLYDKQRNIAYTPIHRMLLR